MLLPDTLQVLENDLVASRQADRSIGSHDFNRLGTGKLCENSILFPYFVAHLVILFLAYRWLTMGRLMSASFGETCLSLEHWQMVMELERLRRERLK